MLEDHANNVARKAHPIDVHVGGRVRFRRVFLGFSQEKLAKALGLTFQQIQKYERGANRISASRLYELAQLLDVPLTFFFEGVEEIAGERNTAAAMELRSGTHFQSIDPDFVSQRETLNLISSYYRISDADVRTEVLGLLKSLGRSEI